MIVDHDITAAEGPNTANKKLSLLDYLFFHQVIIFVMSALHDFGLEELEVRSPRQCFLCLKSTQNSSPHWVIVIIHVDALTSSLTSST